MFRHADLKGDALPPHTVCLTYDDGPGEVDGDGPGPHTRELGRYLFEQGILAVFFVVGHHAERHRDTLRQLKDWGHTIGNHTYSHPGLVSLALSGGDVIGEVARTDAIIRDYVADGVVYFRAPYGNWREKADDGSGAEKATSIVAELLNRSGRFPHYVGPVNWDITAKDWEFWRRGEGAEECARAYFDEIERVGRGIVLMHDSSEEAGMRDRNRTMQATKLLVPALQRQGYRFAGLDAAF